MGLSSDLQTFNGLYTDYHDRLVRFAHSYVRDFSVAEDITTEAFIGYWKNMECLPEDVNVPAYLVTAIKNKCLNYLSRSETQSRILSHMKENAKWELGLRISSLEACDPEGLFSSEIESIVEETLAGLPEKTFEIFRLSRYKDQSHKEIAEALNISTKGVEFHISKALAKLRKNLKDYMISFFLFFFL